VTVLKHCLTLGEKRSLSKNKSWARLKNGLTFENIPQVTLISGKE
jgi:hypothetical protein